MSQEYQNQAWCGEVTNELRHINLTLDDILRRIEAIESGIAAAFAQHEAYHRANEHRWGVMTWGQRYPLRFALLVTALLLWVVKADTSVLSAFVRQVMAYLGQ